MTQDEAMMQEALELARAAAAAGEAPIGCVITLDGEIVGRGKNCRESAKSALGHAEILAIDEACRNLGGWRLWKCRLYVTLEPCPMCAGAILNARIPTVVYGAGDPKAGAVAAKVRLFDLGFNHRPEVISGVLEEECAGVLRDFFQRLRAEKRRERAGEIPENIDKTAN